MGEAPQARDVRLFTEENVLEQLKTAPYALGYYTLAFYADQGKPVNRMTDSVATFYLYPSGGTLRDGNFNIVLYSSKFDTYRGFRPPSGGGSDQRDAES